MIDLSNARQSAGDGGCCQAYQHAPHDSPDDISGIMRAEIDARVTYQGGCDETGDHQSSVIIREKRGEGKDVAGVVRGE